ncbi:hypothetical protein [Puerhibacterium sp. TATVAM-FAB25]|uniref:hypothetical protein n=1 Tax=Puerhibacterium sp. TATVAM-FAB25 TaxID=3093699 RepID=UPI0039792643
MTTGNLLDAHVRGYAQAVRLHLADLGPEVVEDLTDGLEADLAEALADRMPWPFLKAPTAVAPADAPAAEPLPEGATTAAASR